MNPERWEKISEILERALALEAAQCAKFLDRACAGDSELRQEVESLLASHEQAGSVFLHSPQPGADGGTQTQLPLRVPIAAGRSIGPYLVEKEVGHGGMGEVFSAVRADGQYEKKVAIKLVRAGYDTAAVLERFRNERQILAGLDHPNIARLLDGGNTEGIPYLVMELVEGVAIDGYCDARKLKITERLQLFRQVCAAVQYAHQRLVIHRDIKPSNILVTTEGVPKLLDFGIAKLLDASGRTEATILRPMTPEYASPEQIRGEPITTATDVYSLGVVLYQLLTGHSPYRLAASTPAKLAEAITHEEPERPSTSVQRTETLTRNGEACELTPESVSSTREDSPLRLQRRLRGDLDAILLRALRKEPSLRYVSVAEFAEDIGNHLDRLPVAARKGTWSYRSGKFVRRHRAGAAAAALVLLTLVAGVIVTVREARIAEANRRRAEARFNDVRKLANSLMFEVHDSIRDLPGSTPARKLIVDRAREYLNGLARDASGDPALQRELATAYEKLGDVQGNPTYANLGDTPGALESYRKALQIREALLPVEPNEVAAHRGLSALYNKIGSCLAVTGDFAGALASDQQALQLAESYATKASGPEDRDWLAGGYFVIGGLLTSKGDFDAALQNYRKAMTIHEAAGAAYPANLNLRTHLAGDYSYAAHVLMLQGDLDQAIDMNGRAVEIMKQMTTDDPKNATFLEFLSQSYFHQADMFERKNELAEALEYYRRGQSILLELSSRDPRNALTGKYLGFTHVHLGTIMVRMGKARSGLADLQKGLAIFESLQKDSKNRYVLSGLADSYEGLGRANTALALTPRISSAERAAHWRAARKYYVQSQSIWLGMRKQGALAREDAEKLGPISVEIAKCDSALAQFPH